MNVISTTQCFQRKDGLTRLICTECGERFLVADVNEVIKCPYCRIISGNPTETFISFYEYLKESREWY